MNGPDAETLVPIPRLARRSDMDRIVLLHEAGVATLPPGVVRRDDIAYFTRMIDDGGCIVADLDGLVVGYGGFLLFGRGESYLAAALRMNEVPIAHLESSAVDRLRRGTGLHRRLIAWRMKRIRARGFEHVLTSVSPRNAASLSNLVRCGFVVRALTLLYGGLSRYVLEHRCLDASLGRGDPTVTLPAADEGRCGELLREGWVGVAGVRRDDHLELVFEK